MTTTQDGDVRDPNTWLGGVAPTGTDSLDIQHNVSISGSFECDSITISDNKTVSLDAVEIKAGAVSLGDGAKIRAVSGDSMFTCRSLELGSRTAVECADDAQLKISTRS